MDYKINTKPSNSILTRLRIKLQKQSKPHSLIMARTFVNKYLRSDKIHDRGIFGQLDIQKYENKILKLFKNVEQHYNLEKPFDHFTDLVNSIYRRRKHFTIKIDNEYNRLINLNIQDRLIIYVNNVEKQRVTPTRVDQQARTTAEMLGCKRYINFCDEQDIIAKNQMITTNYNSNGITYKPHGLGKTTPFGEEAPANWVYFLKIKHAFKVRDASLLSAMRNDLRVYLTTAGLTLDNQQDFINFNRAIVNAFVLDEVELYAHSVLSSKHVMSGIDSYNKICVGDFSGKLLDYKRAGTVIRSAQVTSL